MAASLFSNLSVSLRIPICRNCLLSTQRARALCTTLVLSRQSIQFVRTTEDCRDRTTGFEYSERSHWKNLCRNNKLVMLLLLPMEYIGWKICHLPLLYKLRLQFIYQKLHSIPLHLAAFMMEIKVYILQARISELINYTCICSANRILVALLVNKIDKHLRTICLDLPVEVSSRSFQYLYMRTCD